MNGSQVITVPKWAFVLRVIQIFFAIVLLGISAYGLYWIAFSSWGFMLFTCLVTVIIALYNVLTSKVSTLKKAYNYWAILALDIVGVIFWLSSMAAVASTRATFKYPTTIDTCVHDGNGGVCFKARDENLVKRTVYVATRGYLNMMVVAALLGALEMFLFIATLVIFAINLKKQRSSTSGPETAADEGKLEAQLQPMNPQTYQQVPQQQSYPQQTYSQDYPQQYPQQYQQQTEYVSPTSTPQPYNHNTEYISPSSTPHPQQHYHELPR